MWRGMAWSMFELVWFYGNNTESKKVVDTTHERNPSGAIAGFWPAVSPGLHPAFSPDPTGSPICANPDSFAHPSSQRCVGKLAALLY